MICATKRRLRRQIRPATPTLDAMVSDLRKRKKEFGVHGRQIGRRIQTTILVNRGVVTAGFRHPTKKATAGRYVFLTVRQKDLT